MMHPIYKKSRRKIRVVGALAIALGVLGLISPIIPGFVLLLVGLSVLSLQSSRTYDWVAELRSKHPKLAHQMKTLESKIADLFNLTTHSHEYLDIPRRDGTSLATLLEVSPVNLGVAILLHGATGTKETPLMHALADAMRARGLSVIRFDAYNGIGEGGGSYDAFTATSMYADLEDVLAWARQQTWWHEEVTLVGHSVGGLVAATYAALHQSEVHELMLFAPMVSGDSYLRTYKALDALGLERWQIEGERTVMHPLSGESRKLSFNFVKDACGYSLEHEAGLLTMPTSIIVGTADRTTLESECALLAKAIGAHASVTSLPGIPHTPIERKDLKTLYKAFLTVHTDARP